MLKIFLRSLHSRHPIDSAEVSACQTDSDAGIRNIESDRDRLVTYYSLGQVVAHLRFDARNGEQSPAERSRK